MAEEASWLSLLNRSFTFITDIFIFATADNSTSHIGINDNFILTEVLKLRRSHWLHFKVVFKTIKSKNINIPAYKVILFVGVYVYRGTTVNSLHYFPSCISWAVESTPGSVASYSSPSPHFVFLKDNVWTWNNCWKMRRTCASNRGNIPGCFF